MKLIIGKTAGFCYGVNNAVEETKKALKNEESTYCLGEIVHNSNVVKELEDLGLKVIENLDEIDTNNRNINVVIRAHGVTPEIYNRIETEKYNLIDLTCPNVLMIHKIAEDFKNKGYYILLIGQRQHPEVIGTVGFCEVDNENNCSIIENKEDIDKAIDLIYESNKNKVLIITQTTFSLEKFNILVEYIKDKLNVSELEIRNTICNATKIKQEETEKLSKEVEYMIIIGGKNSSNTRKLYDISHKNCANTVIVENPDELNINEIKEHTLVGIMAGASTPSSSIEGVIRLLK